MTPTPTPRAVRLGADSPLVADLVADLVAEAVRLVDQDVASWLDLAATWGPRLPLPGAGATATRWELLASAGAVDLGIARALEPHADALAILAEAGTPAVPGATWGVYAAEGRGVRVTATEDAGGWTLHGVKPWCSLAGQVTHALVTAWVAEDARGLFAVPLAEARDRGHARVDEVAWVSRGLTTVVSGPVTFTGCAAEPVGGPGWYLRRDGFAWGGIGVAAVWYGGAVGVARRLRRATAERPLDQVGLAHLGAVDAALAGARALLRWAAGEVDAGRATGAAGELLAARTRTVVADAAERVLGHVDHALGPAPLTQEEDHARRVADLRVYLRQHHGERDQAALGRLLTAAAETDGP